MSERGVNVGGKMYNVEKSIYLCDTPQGTLYKKKGRATDFYLYNPDGKTNREKYVIVSWADANNLTKTYGDRDVHLQWFSTVDKSTDPSKTGNSVIRLDDYHRMKVMRNADKLGISMREYVMRLIDKDDEQNNYCL